MELTGRFWLQNGFVLGTDTGVIGGADFGIQLHSGPNGGALGVGGIFPLRVMKGECRNPIAMHLRCKGCWNKGRRQKAEMLCDHGAKKSAVTWCYRIRFRHASGGHFLWSVTVADRARFSV